MPFRRSASASPRARRRRALRGRLAGTAGRVALPAAYLGARRARGPFVLWSALWATRARRRTSPRRPLLRHIHRRADAVVTYGPHVSAYARRLGRARPSSRRRRRSTTRSGRRRTTAARRAAVHGAVRRARRAREGPRRAARGLARAAGLRRRRDLVGRVGADAVGRPPSGAQLLRRAPTSWSCRPCARVASASRGGWSPTKP